MGRDTGVRALTLVAAALLLGAATVTGAATDPVVTLAAIDNAGGAAMTTALTCPLAGSCVAGGFYTDAAGQHQAYVAQQTNGSWGSVIRLGTILNVGGNAATTALSCADASDCVAVGFYTDAAGQHQAFFVQESSGLWGSTQTVAGPLNTGGDAVATTVSCASADSCVVGGRYRDGAGKQRAFAALESGGTWGEATQVGAVVNLGGNATLSASSCPGVGTCVVAGSATTASTTSAFVDTEHNGLWSKPLMVVPGSAATSSAITDLVCSAVGSCAAVGTATMTAGRRAIAVLEQEGAWGTVTALGAPVATEPSSADAVACTSTRACSVLATASTPSGTPTTFVATEVAGHWAPARAVAPVAGPLGLPVASATGTALTCPAVGACVIAGELSLATGGPVAFTVAEQAGIWGRAALVAQGDNAGHDAAALTVACAPGGSCLVGGRYTDAARHFQSFVAPVAAYQPVLVLRAVRGTVPARGAATIVIWGSGFYGTPRVQVVGLALRVVAVSPQRLVVRIVRTHLTPGRHLLTVTDPNGSSGTSSIVQR
ncbi:MAG: hypothetical protein ACP5OV_06230 [Acidimicrobiales bacterium]